MSTVLFDVGWQLPTAPQRGAQTNRPTSVRFIAISPNTIGWHSSYHAIYAQAGSFAKR